VARKQPRPWILQFAVLFSSGLTSEIFEEHSVKGRSHSVSLIEIFSPQVKWSPCLCC